MNKVLFKFKNHPGDLFRSTDIVELPDPDQDLEGFLVQFLPMYQTDDTVALLNDLYKISDDNLFDNQKEIKFIEQLGFMTKEEVESEIPKIESQLKMEAYKHFYGLIYSNEIEIIQHGEKE